LSPWFVPTELQIRDDLWRAERQAAIKFNTKSHYLLGVSIMSRRLFVAISSAAALGTAAFSNAIIAGSFMG
jgi:hypothetical protein